MLSHIFIWPLSALAFTALAFLQPQLHNPQLPLHDLTKKSPLLTLHRNLVEIESITGNEHAVGSFLVKYLRSHNLTVDIHPVSSPSSDSKHKHPSRFNIHAYIGSNRTTSTLLTSHIDTVPPYYPYHTTKHSMQIWGRGSVDAKAAVAAQITAFQELRTDNKFHEGSIGLLFVVGEETGGDGMRAVNDLKLSWDAVIFGEPTDGRLACGHKGFLGFTLQAKGKAAHSGYPWLGRSANSILIPALMALEGLNGKERLPSSEKYGESTLNVGRIEGGVAANVVAERGSAGAAIRIAGGTVGEVRGIVLEAVDEATRDLLGEDGHLEVVFPSEGYGPVDIDCDVEGFETVTVNYGTDIPNLHGDHKRYLYGPGSILVAHSDHEHLSVKELEKAVEDYKKIVLACLAK